jgi:hypothetical protein
MVNDWTRVDLVVRLSLGARYLSLGFVCWGEIRGKLFSGIVKNTMNLKRWAVGPGHDLAKGSSRSGRETNVESKGLER